MGKMIMFKRKRGFKFKGWDWTELGRCWGLSNRLSDEEAEKEIVDILCSVIYDKAWEKHKKVVLEDARRFLKKIVEQKKRIAYSWPVYDGLSKIKNDETFVQYFRSLLTSMWT